MIKIRCRRMKDGVQCPVLTWRIHPFCYKCTQEALHLSVAKSTLGEEAGYGLFAYNPNGKNGCIVFREGEYIAPYGGQILTEEQLDDRYSVYEDKSTVAPYAYADDNGLIYDAAIARGVAAYANDNKDKTKINSEFSSKPHLCIRATRNIHQHEEIFLDYGQDYWANAHMKYEIVEVEESEL
jgi:SET domain-containing protein